MIRLTQGLGVLLIALGLAGYTLGETQHWTALLPAGLGAVVLVLGIVAALVSAHQHFVHAALVLALLGALGSLRQVGALVTGDTGIAPVVGTLAAVACAVYVGLGIRSFVAARKAREQSGV
ncbi:hypothetical protein ER308_00780 [Egibacter rhizosphaerae]|uniref:Uncharacterized protein n=1 Tax=Egibacter rhizosphaerae TaxID=1670831 RepID=A0A411YAP5_9ACTN|nr:hypothetical protein [Egibacter rhizosphaerae]QBI18248.1 hypothetical protein ER308_00780 [Egibacter rhizosphaerae]